MARVVLPLVSTTDVVDAVTAADIGVSVKVVVNVDVDIVISPAASPTPAAAPRSS